MSQSTTEKQWTILSLINWSNKYLKEKGASSPRLTAELLLAEVLKCQRIHLYTRFDQPLEKDELKEYKKLLLRRLSGEPVQYILGRAEFFGRSFIVNPNVLIPRPETEHVVECVLELVNSKTNGAAQRTINILDVGTGSGVIAVTLAAENPHIQILAIDSSDEVLTVAKENAHRNNVTDRIVFKQLDIYADAIFANKEKYDFIVSNPPYIAKEEWKILPKEIKDFEPQQALTDQRDGLSYFRRLSELAPTLLSQNGWLVTEVGYKQGERIMTMYKNSGAKSVRAWKDLSGNLRVVGGMW